MTCANCCHRQKSYTGTVWMHPGVAVSGFGFCSVFPDPNREAVLCITPNNYICALFKERDGGQSEQLNAKTVQTRMYELYELEELVERYEHDDPPRD